MVTAIGYTRVSTNEQHAHGGGLEAQRKAIRAEATRRGWQLVEIVGEESGSSSATLERAGLQSVLRRMDAGEADVLLVAKLDRLSRSVAQGALVMERAKRRGWALVAMDFGLDTTTPAGEMVANVILSTAQYERRLIGERTKAALAVKREQGVILGRPRALSQPVVDRILAEHAEGRSSRAIAAGLDADNVPTARGGPGWASSTVAKLIRTR